MIYVSPNASHEYRNDRKYDTQINMHDIKKMFKYGVAFSGKKVEIVSEEAYVVQ